MNVAEAIDARIAEDAIIERVRDEEEGIATLMRRKKFHTIIMMMTRHVSLVFTVKSKKNMAVMYIVRSTIKIYILKIQHVMISKIDNTGKTYSTSQSINILPFEHIDVFF